jgi:hypothetical protein
MLWGFFLLFVLGFILGLYERILRERAEELDKRENRLTEWSRALRDWEAWLTNSDNEIPEWMQPLPSKNTPVV